MQNTTGLIWSIQVGLPEQRHPDPSNDPAQKPWATGIFKRTVTGPVRLHRHNLEGDGQADLVHHGVVVELRHCLPSHSMVTGVRVQGMLIAMYGNVSREGVRSPTPGVRSRMRTWIAPRLRTTPVTVSR